MKGYRTTTTFDRHFRTRISPNEQLIQDYLDSIEAFLVDRTLVDDHELQNVMQGKRAFSINNEYRVVYVERDDHYRFLDVGTHEQVYRTS